ncbi:LipA and NB-ARC domain-containing protein, partial [Colletotrichum limetticola]
AELLRKAFNRAPPAVHYLQASQDLKEESTKLRVAQSYPDAQRPDSNRQLQVLPKADELERSYPCQALQRRFSTAGSEVYPLRPADQRDIYVRIFLAIEQSDQALELRELSKRFHCYALARLHPKGTTIDPTVTRIKKATSDYDGVRQKVYNILWMGRKWATTVGLLDSIIAAANISVGVPSLLGILWVLGPPST